MIRTFSHNRTTLRLAHDIPGRLRVRSAFLRHPRLQEEVLEASLAKTAPVREIRLNRKLGSLVVTYDPQPKARHELLSQLCTLPDEVFDGNGEPDESPDFLGLVLSAGLCVVSNFLPKPARPAFAWLRNLPFILRGMETLIERGIKVEVLDAVTLSVLTLQGRYQTAGITRLMLDTGEYLETSIRYRSTGLLKTLLRPATESVWVETEGIEREIPFEQLRIGETVVVGSGELIPVDGVVSDGQATVNQASVTGESVPVALEKGSTAHAGSVVVDGRLKVQVQTVGSEVSTARISSFIKQALVSKSQAQDRAEKLADNLVPATFASGAAVLALTKDINRTAAVFAVDFSCAIKLICPTAQKAAMYAIARHGVLVRSASGLESLAGIDALVFDKTGTVTTGQFSITSILPFDGFAPNEILGIAAAAEEHYTHPIARAVVAEAKRLGITIPNTSEVDFVVAHGVSAYVDDHLIRVGSRHFIHDDEGIDCSRSDVQADALRQEGNTILYVARDEVLIGILALSDTIRSDSRLCLDCFRSLGVRRLVMLTGDNEITARAVADALGVEARWDLKPQDKAGVVRELKDAGYKVAFLGDGVNDAPALVTADLGVAMALGADIAREAAEIVLMRDDLLPLVHAYGLARNVQEKIRLGMNASIGVNSLALLLSAMGRLSPLSAALIHNGSTVGTLLYALFSAKTSGRTEATIRALSGGMGGE